MPCKELNFLKKYNIFVVEYFIHRKCHKIVPTYFFAKSDLAHMYDIYTDELLGEATKF